ncbi:hypothetical protein HAX54_008776, partial [Datura stramonium]|nr:hypothetical protein [Datura stramonium]
AQELGFISKVQQALSSFWGFFNQDKGVTIVESVSLSPRNMGSSLVRVSPSPQWVHEVVIVS